MKKLLLVAALLAVPAAAAAQIPDHSADLNALRAQYPATMNDVQTGELMGRLAFKLRGEGFGLLRKDGGNHCPVNGLGVLVSCDWIIYQPGGRGCDILSDAGGADGPGTSRPAWCGGNGDVAPGPAVIVSTDPGALNVVGPPPPPPPTDTVTKAQLDSALAALAMQLQNDVTRQIGELKSYVDTRLSEHSATNAVSEDRVKAMIVAAFASAVVDGKTRTSFGHQHMIHLGVTIEK